MHLVPYDKILRLAHENQVLSGIERKTLLFMAHVLQNKIGADTISKMLPRRTREAFTRDVAPSLGSHSRIYLTRALVITFHLLGIHPSTVADFFRLSARTVRDFIRQYSDGDIDWLFGRKSKPKKFEDSGLRDRLFAVMHSPPRDYGINRTTWTIDLLRDVLENNGVLVGKNTISKIIRREGYVFRKTREVLTSNDPEYKTKLQKITRILRHLGPADRFFSIDEYGPFSVRERGGRRRVLKNEKPTIPQFQNSRGYLIVTAALELSTNEVTHFYSGKKDTEEMIKLLHILISKYAGCRRLYFSWDAASWHSSKVFLAEVKRINAREYRNENQSPMVKLTPLPARAQFLNVIESVFSGMARSVIHHSNYESLDAARGAIDRYFTERNVFFAKHPRKAGNKIWGEEQVPSRFSVSHNCKDPRLMRLATVR